MAYRRRQQNPPPPSISTPGDELYTNSTINFDDSYGFMGLDRNESNLSTSTGGSSLATRAIRASSGARRDSSLSSAYAFNSSSYSSSLASNSMASATSTTASSKDSPAYEYTSMKSMNDSKQGFWSSLARKAKSILDDDDPQQMDSPRRNRQDLPNAARVNYKNEYPSLDHQRKVENPKLQKGLHAISSSLNYIGNAVEEGLTIVENRTADLIQGTRNHIKKKPGADAENQSSNYSNIRKQTHLHTQGQQQTQTDLNLQLKASRDVAMAMAAKAKLLLRELKTVKADLAFAKERCAQLEDENKILRENHGRGDHPDDDDLIRLQLETLLAEKARLAHENSIFARENRFLREVVEYHQLTMQDVVYFDEGTEEVTEVYPIKVVTDETFDKSVVVDKASPPVPVPPPGLSQAFKK